MNIHARFSVVRHVRITTRIDERIRADARQHADRDSQDHPRHYMTDATLKKHKNFFLIHLGFVKTAIALRCGNVYRLKNRRRRTRASRRGSSYSSQRPAGRDDSTAPEQ